MRAIVPLKLRRRVEERGRSQHLVVGDGDGDGGDGGRVVVIIIVIVVVIVVVVVVILVVIEGGSHSRSVKAYFCSRQFFAMQRRTGGQQRKK